MSNYINSVVNRFETYKLLGEKCFDQLTDEDIQWQYNEASNSIAITVKHIVGNMHSRFTNFLTEDGEKPWSPETGYLIHAERKDQHHEKRPKIGISKHHIFQPA